MGFHEITVARKFVRIWYVVTWNNWSAITSSDTVLLTPMGLNQSEAKVSDYGSTTFALLQGARMGQLFQVTMLFLIWFSCTKWLWGTCTSNQEQTSTTKQTDHVVSCFIFRRAGLHFYIYTKLAWVHVNTIHPIAPVWTQGKLMEFYMEVLILGAILVSASLSCFL